MKRISDAKQERGEWSRLVKIKKRGILLLWVLSLLSMTAIGVFSHASVTYAKDEISKEKRYTSIQIEEGDTLWSIAGEHLSPEYKSINDFIYEVKRINHISGDEIHAEAFLVIPYYTTR